MKFLFVICLCMLCNFLPFNSFSQTWNWAKGEGDIGSDVSNSVVFDNNGTVYITGNFAGRADFSGTVYQGNGLYDIYIACYSPQGNLLWVKNAGGKGNDQGNSIKYYNDALYVTGFFSDTAWFENTALVSKGEEDVFIAKYDESGNLLWVRQAGGTKTDYGSSLDVDDNGNVFIAGSYANSISFDTVHLSTNNIYTESFFAKYNSEGDLLWAKTTEGNNANLITGVAFDNHYSFFITGYFGASFKIGNTVIHSATASYDIFLAKIDNDGNLDWLRRAGGTFEDAAHAVCSDKEGNPSITGYFAGTANFDNNSVTYHDYNDIFVARYDSSGNNIWVRAGRGQQLDAGFAITSDDEGNIFSTGMFETAVDFDGRGLIANAASDKDIFLVSYDKSGNIRWVTSAGGFSTDCALGVAVSHTGNVAICGYYLFACSFGNIAIDYAQGNDLFIAEFQPPVVNSVKHLYKDEIILQPNPCADYLHVSFPNSSNADIQIFDVTGSKLKEISSSGNFIKLNTSAFINGIYFLSIENNEGVVMKKFAVE